ncbi:MAG: FAD-dependent oxidoreductase [Pseudomonadales bacterium]|nr:FAD-dependent oxidoreductase [Pseudomonadales bacterium]
MPERRCIIVGAGHAASQLATSLRQEGWTGQILLIGEEACLPYNRPPLSKTFLSGEKSLDDILIRHAAAYEKMAVEFMLGVGVARIDRNAKKVILTDDTELEYDKLALTTGSRARRVELPGSELAGVCYLRNIADVAMIQNFVAAGRQAVIVGGGYIGLETAAMLKQCGMGVTVLELASRVMNRVTAPEVSAFYTRVHREEGVTIVTDVAVSGFEGTTAVQAVNCADGRTFTADLVVMGIGVVPNVELAQAAGLQVDNGILVDGHGRSSDPDIVAAGDCTRHYNPGYQAMLRLESVQNAVDQAKVAAATLCENPKEYNALPWFWSDQFDVKLQIAGISSGYDALVIRGDIEQGRKFAAFYLNAGHVIAVDAVNSPLDFLQGKRLIIDKIPVNLDDLANAQIPVKALLDAVSG